ncbi:Uncharacterized protein Adt_39316 [Abeliophyllum distichum]|uniref:Reverse transcriptase domain-containing protein n=1 Tax=Abeliophyllum distichum TaxID=126358 RepID=A0ABD1Q4R6_9LAMI
MSSPEQAAYAQNFQRQQNNPYSQTYNPGWRNHPNFSYGPSVDKEIASSKEREANSEKAVDQEKESSPPKYIPPPAYVPPIPFPQRLRKHKLDQQFKKFLDVFKKLQINIPFADALAQMPSYAKFMKDILANKRKLEEHETVMLTEECSAILQNKLPPKLKDPGSLIFLALLLGLGEAKPTTVTLQLADRSIKRPRGIVEDILVKVGKFIFPADFIILDMCEDRDVPLILGRPFLATGRAVIDVQKGELMLKVNDEHITFNVFKEIKFQSSPDSCFEVDATDQEKSNTSTLKNQSDQKEHTPVNKSRVEEQLSDEENETFIVEFEQGGKTQSYQYDKGKIKLWKGDKKWVQWQSK